MKAISGVESEIRALLIRSMATQLLTRVGFAPHPCARSRIERFKLLLAVALSLLLRKLIAQSARCKQVADDVGGLELPNVAGVRVGSSRSPLASRQCGRNRQNQIVDRFDRGEALRRCVFHRIEILIGE